MTEDAMYTGETETIRETIATDGQVIMPFYLVADVSSSMSRDTAALTDAVDEFVRDIQKDPVVDDLVMLSIITFNHTARTVVPLQSPSDVSVPAFSASGGTSYTAAFEEYNRAFEADRARLKLQGMKVFRPCVFFLTDGEPNERDHLGTFRRLFAYDPGTRVGNRAFPYFVPYGFRSARVEVIRQLAYPDFGMTKGRYYLSRSNNVAEILKEMAMVLGNTVISSGMSASQGAPQIIPPSPPSDPTTQFGEAGDWM